MYEVIGKGKLKPFSDKHLEKEPRQSCTGIEPAEGNSASLNGPSEWPKRPKMVQLLDGRLETSIPYTVVIAIVLGCILLFLVFFRLGQLYEQNSQPTVSAVENLTENKKPDRLTIAEGGGVIYEMSRQQPESAEEKMQADSQELTGSNHIVIMQYHSRKDLEPAKKYFDENGIETEIEQRGSLYFLVTKKDTYNNPSKEGTDGFIAKEEIKKIGAGYEAPPGYERFVFKDPYGEKVK